MKKVIFILLMSWTSISLAAIPKCVTAPFTTSGTNIVLPGSQDSKNSVVYFFQNKSFQSVWIDHPDTKRRGASAGWTSYVRPSNWAALVLNKKNFTISCLMIHPGKVESLDCAKVLSICSPQNLVSAQPLQGNYWLVEDKSWDNFIKTIEKKGMSFQ